MGIARRPQAAGLLVRVALGTVLTVAAARAAAPRSAAEWLAEGDQHYAQAHLPEARQAYLQAVTAEPRNLDALCRLARAETELGELQKGDEQRRTWASAVEHARAAVTLAPDSSAGHVWLAVALGRQALREGPRSKLALAREIKSEADRALALNPGVGRAWHVLGKWNAEVAGLNAFERMAAGTLMGGVPAGATREAAAAAFERAIALEPDYVNHHLEYGRLLRDQRRWADARRELERAVSLPPTSDALDARYQAQARALLEKLPG